MGREAAVVIVFLWDATGSGHGIGVSGTETAARTAAEAFLRSGRADAAVVEAAVTMDGTATLTSGYQRTGQAWRACGADPRGDIRWEPLVVGRQFPDDAS